MTLNEYITIKKQCDGRPVVNMFLFSRLNRKLIVSYPKHVNSKKIRMIYSSPLTSDSIVYKSFLFLNRVCSIQPVGLRSLTMKAYVCCLDTMHNDLTSSLSTSILWLFDTMYVFFFFSAKAQKEAYERKEKEKAKQARTQVRN